MSFILLRLHCDGPIEIDVMNVLCLRDAPTSREVSTTREFNFVRQSFADSPAIFFLMKNNAK